MISGAKKSGGGANLVNLGANIFGQKVAGGGKFCAKTCFFSAQGQIFRGKFCDFGARGKYLGANFVISEPGANI